MNIENWQLQTPINTLVFDCDGTLTCIEGIDELARDKGVGPAVQALTTQAMTETGLNPDLFQKRLELVHPSKKEVLSLGQTYYEQRVPAIHEVIQLLLGLNKQIYIISSGLQLAVAEFGRLLQIPTENIFAVDLHFDEQGNYVDFDRTSPLTTNEGKRVFVSQLKHQHSELIYVGDGMNDLAIIDLATRFIGYGGVFFREKIAERCEFYLQARSMTAILPLVLTTAEIASLKPSEHKLYQAGLLQR